LSELEEFEEALSLLIGCPTDLRPFVCEGSPLECEAFIVGLNPASPMKTDFWQFWRSGVGFDKARWFEAYKIERACRPLKPGRQRRYPVSNSRRVIEWLIPALNSVKCLETNIYSAPTEELHDLDHERRITAPFDFLLDKIKPGVVVVHGKDAIAHLRQKALPIKVIEVAHFSRGWNERAAQDLGRQIRAVLGR
jgi:hypothetical protein